MRRLNKLNLSKTPGLLLLAVVSAVVLGGADVADAEKVMTPPFTDGLCRTWHDGSNIIDEGRASCNTSSGSIAAWASAFIGAHAASASQLVEVFIDQPKTIHVEAIVLRMGGTVDQGLAEFTGTEIICWHQQTGDYLYRRQTDEWLTTKIVVQKSIDFVTTYFPPLMAKGGAKTAVEIMGLINQGVTLYDGLMMWHNRGDVDEERIEFDYTAHEPEILSLYFGVRVNASGAATGSGTAFSSGQVVYVKVTNVDPPDPPVIAGPDSLLPSMYGDFEFTVPDNREEQRFIVTWGSGLPDTSDYIAGGETYHVSHRYNISTVPQLFTVTAVAQENDGLKSTPSEAYVLVDRFFPDPPANVTATDGEHCNYVVISWDPTEATDYYNVFDSDDSTVASGVTDTFYVDYDLFPALYNAKSYRVRAKNDWGPSAASDPLEQGHRKDRPRAPDSLRTILDPSPDPCYVEVQWRGYPYGSGGDNNETDYHSVWRASTPDLDSAVVVGEVPGDCSSDCYYRDAPELPGSYYYWVEATNECGSRMSEANAFALWNGYGPQTPFAVDASDGAFCDTISVSWVSDPLLYHKVYRDGQFLDNVYDGLTYVDRSPLPYETHQYRIAAYSDSCGILSPLSDPNGGYAISPAGAPENVAATDGDSCSSVRIVWDHGPGAEEYSVYRDDVWMTTMPSSQSWYNDFTAAPGSLYTYRIESRNSICATYTAAASDSGFRGWVLPPPVNVDASDGEFCNIVFIQWNEVPNAEYYGVLRDGNEIYHVDSTFFVDPWTIPGQRHSYQVKTYSTCMVSDTSWSDTGYRGQPPIPELEARNDYTPGDSVLVYFDFEAGPLQDPQGWYPVDRAGHGHLGTLRDGLTVLGQKGCTTNLSHFWTFFTDPDSISTACPGESQAVPFYIRSEIWSPPIPWFSGFGNDVELRFNVYRDLPLDNLVVYVWRVRSTVGGIPGEWRNHGVVYYGENGWHDAAFQIGDLIEQYATHIEIALGVWDMGPYWKNTLGTGQCHTMAPLFDDVSVVRVNRSGPQWHVRHVDLFQDTFAEDGTLTGTARADAAMDIIPRCGRPSMTILPGDSATVSVSDPDAGLKWDSGRYAVYAYVSVLPDSQPGKDGLDLEAPEMRNGTRYPYVESFEYNGNTWHKYRMDIAVTMSGHRAPDQFCFDLRDDVFTPGDTVCYFFGAVADNDIETYWSRGLDGQGDGFVTGTMGEAMDSPCEFTILPAGGYARGGEILYVDDADDRYSASQQYVELACSLTAHRDSGAMYSRLNRLVDRYDVLGPSSVVGNSLASRVQNVQQQITDTYRKILWCSDDLPVATVGDGTGQPEKSDDFSLLYQFLQYGADRPGVMLFGDNIHQEWETLLGTDAGLLRSGYYNFTLLDDDHEGRTAESPTLVGAHACFGEDTLVVDGDPCLAMPQRDFDVIQNTGSSQVVFQYEDDVSEGAVLLQHSPNSSGTTASVVGAGFDFGRIRDYQASYAPASAHFLWTLLACIDEEIEFALGSESPAPFTNYLDQNFPNPFNPTATIRYGIKTRGHVSLKVYNVAGQLVMTLVDEVQRPAHEYTVIWNGRNNKDQPVASGVYFYKLVTRDFATSKKMVMLK
jgi:hypothetical protein